MARRLGFWGKGSAVKFGEIVGDLFLIMGDFLEEVFFLF